MADDAALDRQSAVPFLDTIATNGTALPAGGTVLSRDATAIAAQVSTAPFTCSSTDMDMEGNDGAACTNDAMGNRRSRKRPNSMMSTVESSLSSSKIKDEKVRSPSKSVRTAKDVPPENPMSWICMECKEAEAAMDEDSDLVLCEGSCNRPFHLVCVGLKEVPINEWKCADCVGKRHACSICQEYGIDQVDVFLCKSKGCGLFFHESCLSMLSVDIKQVDRAVNGSQNHGIGGSLHNPDEGPSETIPEFKCPAHRCWTCTEEIVTKDCDDDNVGPQEGGKNGGKRMKKKKPKDNAFAVKTGFLFVSPILLFWYMWSSIISSLLHPRRHRNASNAALLIMHPAYHRLLNSTS